MVHCKLAVLLKMGKNRVKRVMKKYGIQARRKKKRYIYPGRASDMVLNALHDPQTPAEAEVMFSDIFEIQLADRTKVRGCFALWKRTRHCLSLAFGYQMRANLVASIIELLEFAYPARSFIRIKVANIEPSKHEPLYVRKGFQRSMSRAGTLTGNG